MDVPKFDELIEPTFLALRKLGGSATISEIVETVISNLRLAKEIVEQSHGRGNRTELEYRLAWARTYLKKFGVIDNSERGVWSLTLKGSAYRDLDPKEVVRLVQQESRAVPKIQVIEGTDVYPSVRVDDDSRDEIAAWREELLDTLLTMQPDGFERLCQRLLRESGFTEVEVTGKSGDGGIDGRGIIRVGGLISFHVLFQSKRHKDSLGPNVVRDFRGAMVGRADKGLILSTGSFTREAQKEATRDGAPPIDLIDGDLLIEKLKELGLGVSVKTKQVETIEIDHAWFGVI